MLDVLLGQRCLRLELAYPGELVLHAGDPLAYSPPSPSGQKKGSWRLGMLASWWRLVLADPPYIIRTEPIQPDQAGESSTNPREVEDKASQLIGMTIVAVEPTLYPLRREPHIGIGLLVGFSNGSRLAVIPNDEADEDNDDPLPDWELFTPFHMYLKVGPGWTWSYLRSYVVEEVA